ncbi:lipopolysaccharide biosynthesis protein [Erythrobacter dokdonensis]|uniref:Membrane protein involved in the export of O-antigen and teichoic acid n=1 Tax=Erythrobacter dokdonensis DSW-74 TaxID=1300349 RepID=A0A1A7BFB4_9SPHN|nr:oligosaccharide flippase family protein [Erythrobacter dokdonensis]OBV11213.1 Membrane protein involved in the export of O-antigen and teichoic acid [Erythrobacter dokdonensis DSW-74]
MNEESRSDALRKFGAMLPLLAQKLSLHRVLGGAFLLRGFSLVTGLVLTLLLGRYFGAAATGTYALITQTTTFIVTIGLLGLDLSLVRHLARPKRNVATAVFLRIMGLSGALMLCLVLAILLGGDNVWSGLFGDVIPREFTTVICVLLLIRGLHQTLCGFLHSQKRIALSLMIGLLAVPFAAVCALLSGLAQDVHELLWATAASGFVCMLWALWASTKHLSNGQDAIRVSMRQVLSSSLPLWGSLLTLVMGEWYALAVTARMLSVVDAGVFRVGAQIAAPLSVVSGTITSVYMPQISGAFHAGDRQSAARLARTAVRMSAVLALPVAVGIIIVTPFLLPFIGSEFEAAMPVVVTLLIGQFLIALSGPCGLVLAMSGNEKVNLAIAIAGIACLLVAAPVAATLAGIHGVAISVAAVLVMRNVAAYCYLRYKVGIEVWSGRAMPT